MAVPTLFGRQNSLDSLQFEQAICYILRARISQREACQIETTIERFALSWVVVCAGADSA
jgi:hypothetical protein